MGFLTDDTEEQQSPASALVDSQIEEDRALLESKKQALFDTRLNLIKNQGRESWTPNKPTPSTAPKTTPTKGFQSLF